MDRVPRRVAQRRDVALALLGPLGGTHGAPSPRAPHPRRRGDPQPRRSLPHPRGRSRGRQRVALTPGDSRRDTAAHPGPRRRGSDASRAGATPHARREDDPRRGRARDRGRQSQRESDPTPDSDSSSLGASDATGGIDRSRGASTFYFEYDAPPFVAVSAVPAEGALYACFAVAADEHAKSNAVRTLREVTESFRVGR